MKRESRIYAREQQIKLIDNILCSLCSVELNSDGRKYLKKIKEEYLQELEQLKTLEKESEAGAAIEPFRGFRFRFPHSLKAPW